MMQRRNLKSLQDPKIVDNRTVSIDIPSGYEHMIKGDKFIWLKRSSKRNTSLLIYQVPLRSITNKDNLVANIIKCEIHRL
jgi:hypothetical protein